MLVFGHVASAGLAARTADRTADLRWIVFFTLLADLIDKPLGLVVFSETINNGRVWFHSLFVNLLITLVLALMRQPLVYVLALWMHQLCDRMWMRPWVALWPLTGAFGYRDLPIDQWVYGVLNRYNVTTELAGLAFVAFFVWRMGLLKRGNFVRWLRSGMLPGR